MSRALAVGVATLLVVVGAPLAASAVEDEDMASVVADLTVTKTTRDGATFAIGGDLATFDINGAAATFSLETTETTGDKTVVTLASDLLFEFGRSDLTGPASAALGDLANEIPRDAAVAVDGYTDSIGGQDVNMALSQDRAQTVLDALAAARPDLALTPVGHGSADPVAPNTHDDGSDNPAGRQLNRRVTLTYTTG